MPQHFSSLLFFICFSATLCAAQVNVESLPKIVLQKPVEADISADAVRDFRLSLENNETAELILEQTGANLRLELLDGADGEILAAIDFNPHEFGTERVLFRNDSKAREILVRVASAEKTAGKFKLLLTALEKPNKRNTLRLNIQNSILESRNFKTRQTLEAVEKSRTILENALDTARRANDTESAKDILILLQESYLEILGRDKGKSANYGKAALALLAGSENSYDYARIQVQLGSALVEMGEVGEGISNLNNALTAARRFGDESMQLLALTNLGLAHQRLGDSAKSFEYAENALKLAKKRDEAISQIENLKVIGRLYYGRGDFPKAIELLEEALRLVAASDNESKFTIYNDLATNLLFLGQLQKANDYLHQSLTYYREISGNKWNEAATLQSIALNYSTLGQSERAVEYSRQAAALYETLGYRDARIGVARTKAYIYRNAGDFAAEKQSYLEALKLAETSGDKVITADLYKSLGAVERRAGNYNVALEFYLKAAELNGQAESLGLQAASKIAVSDLYLLLEKNDQAAAFAADSLATARAIGDRITESNALYNLARVSRRRNQFKEALELAEDSLKIVEAVRADLISQESRRAYFSTIREKYDFYIELLLENGAQTRRPEMTERAFAVSERARARGLIDQLAESFLDISAGIKPELKKREQKIQAKISSLQTQFVRLKSKETPNETQIAELERQIRLADNEREQLESEIRHTNPRYAELKYPATLNLRQTQNLLDENTVFLEYQTGREASFLFAVTRKDFRVVRLPDEQNLRRSVENLRRGISAPTRTGVSNYLLSARELYQNLLAPVAELLEDKTKLVISGDSALNYLPFEVLLTDDAAALSFDKLPYLVRRFEISYTPSATVFANLQSADNAPKSQNSFLAFAAPDYQTKSAALSKTDRAERTIFGDNRRWDFSELKNAAAEARQIAKLFPEGQSQVLSGAAATEEKAKSNELLSRYRYLHFAVHGLIDETRPQFSSLVLSLPKTENSSETPAEDGLLQMPEIFNLRLRADLVVLSACQTGLGKELRGEGIVGLTRAFFYAGTPSVLVSLWNVDDASTAELMTYFYENLKKSDGRDKSAALREAQLKMVAGSRFAHPYYWAAFVLQGNSAATAVNK